MEKFKARPGQGKVRLASTTGNVCLVGEEWKDVPESLVTEALKKRLIPKDFYDDIRKEVEAELTGGGENPEGAKTEGPNPPDERQQAILKALARIAAEVKDGKTETENGVKLLKNDNTPQVRAVAEYSGVQDVTSKDIEEAIQ